MAVLADQHSRCLATAQEDESLLNYSQGNFLLVTEDENGKAGGCYLAFDSDRHRFLRPGASCSTIGMIGR
jgi:hypothetical protein